MFIKLRDFKISCPFLFVVINKTTTTTEFCASDDGLSKYSNGINSVYGTGNAVFIRCALNINNYKWSDKHPAII